MGLIKSANVPTSLSPFSLHDIEMQAQAILSRAQRRAEELLIAAQAEGEELKRAAQAEGMARGLREGTGLGLEQGNQAGRDEALAEQRERLQDLLTSLTAATRDLDVRRHELESAALEEVVELAIAIARRVTKRQGMLDPKVLGENLQEAMKLVVRHADVRIAVNPTQRQTLDDALPRLGMEWPALKHVKIVEDAALSQGGCRIYTGQGQVDADLDIQLDRVIADLLPNDREQVEA
jgi:flagellar assembly protein FliH